MVVVDVVGEGEALVDSCPDVIDSVPALGHIWCVFETVDAFGCVVPLAKFLNEINPAVSPDVVLVEPLAEFVPVVEVTTFFDPFRERLVVVFWNSLKVYVGNRMCFILGDTAVWVRHPVGESAVLFWASDWEERA